MTTRMVFATLAIMATGLAANGQYNPQPNPPYVPYTPAQPPQPQMQPASPDVVRIVGGAQYVPASPFIETSQGAIPRLSDSQLGDLTASIALYPDPVIAEMLPASTFIEEIAFADKWLAQHPGADERAIDGLPVDDSVKVMMHYPTVLSMMADHLDWSQALGVSFAYQRQDLMDSIQRWRTTAVQFGTLASSPQLDVFQQGQMILIVPAPEARIVYVPVYDPRIVYVRPVRPLRDAITFGTDGFALSLVVNDVDWRGHEVRVPVHHDDHGGPGGGRGGSSVVVAPGGRGVVVATEKTAFVPKDIKPGVTYAEKIAIPEQDKKVIVIPDARGGRGDNGRGPDNGRGRGPGDRGN